MLYQEIIPLSIKKLQTEPVNRREERIPLLGETKEQCFNRHLARCIFKEGDFIKFKKPRRNPIYGCITAIDEKIEDATWTQKGLVPNYIHVQVTETVKKTGEIKTFVIKTHEGRILYIGRAKETIQ